MKTEIKERIELVQQGKVPNKYRYTRAGIMPEDWIKREPYKAANLFRNYINKKHGGAFEVLSVTQEQGIIPRTQIDIDIKYDEDNVPGYKKVDHGDFVISLRSFQGGIEYSGYEGLVSPAYTVLKPVLPIVNEYYRAYFKSEDFISRLNAAVYGIRDGKQIGYEDFGELVLHYPPISEQEKIAEIFIQCDKVIELKKHLIEEKKRQKKWLMQNLLNPDSGVRLLGFEGEWDYRILQDIITVSKEKIDPQSTNVSYRCIELEHIESNTGRILDWVNSKEQLSIKNIFMKGDILFGKLRPYLRKVSLAPYDGICSSEIWVLKVQPVTINSFMLYSLQSDRFIKAANTTTGTKMPRADWSLLCDYPVALPSIQEQTAIANILSTADHEIDLLEQELAQWQTKKKSLMQLLLTGILRVNI